MKRKGSLKIYKIHRTTWKPSSLVIFILSQGLMLVVLLPLKIRLYRSCAHDLLDVDGEVVVRSMTLMVSLLV